MKEYVWKGSVSGPRYARLNHAIEELAFALGVRIVTLRELKGFLRSNYLFEVSSQDESILHEFKGRLQQAIIEHNKL